MFTCKYAISVRKSFLLAALFYCSTSCAFHIRVIYIYIYIYTLNRHKFDYYSTGLTPGGNARKDEIKEIYRHEECVG